MTMDLNELPSPTGKGETQVDAGVDASPVSLPDVRAMLLADKRSENTRRAYAHDLTEFFRDQYMCDPVPDVVAEFLALPVSQMVRRLLAYKATLIDTRRTEATINRRMSAILSLVAFARRLGVTDADPGDQIDSERTRAYRDTRGIGLDAARRLLEAPDRTTVKGKRDYLLLCLLLENALRRAEITGLTMADVDADGMSLWIIGKGRGTQRERVSLSATTSAALRDYLSSHCVTGSGDAPLLIGLSPASRGRGLTPDGVYKIVRAIASVAGLAEPLSPHRLRHTSITLALDAVSGDIRRVQRLSRHARLETLQIYDDNRTDLQGEVTNQLSRLFHVDSKSSE